MFTFNVGTVDRVVRIIAGLVLIWLGFFALSGAVGIILGIVGLLPLLTGLMGWCPAYLPFKISTKKS